MTAQRDFGPELNLDQLEHKKSREEKHLIVKEQIHMNLVGQEPKSVRLGAVSIFLCHRE